MLKSTSEYISSTIHSSIIPTESEVCLTEFDPTCGQTIISIKQVPTPPLEEKSENPEQKTDSGTSSGFLSLMSTSVLTVGVAGFIILRNKISNEATTFGQMLSESEKGGFVNPLYQSHVIGENPLYEGLEGR
jgi:hypothetical protein